MKDIIITFRRQELTPSEIENQLKFSPYVSDAVVIGDKRPLPHLSGHDRPERMSRSSRRTNDIPFTTMRACAARPEIPGPDPARDRDGQRQFRAVETIKKFFLIDGQLTPEDEELTPTMKLSAAS